MTENNIDLSKLTEEELRAELMRRKKASDKYNYKRGRIFIKSNINIPKANLNKLKFVSDKKREEAENFMTKAEIIFRISKEGDVEPYAFNGNLLSPRKVNYNEVIDISELN